MDCSPSGCFNNGDVGSSLGEDIVRLLMLVVVKLILGGGCHGRSKGEGDSASGVAGAVGSSQCCQIMRCGRDADRMRIICKNADECGWMRIECGWMRTAA